MKKSKRFIRPAAVVFASLALALALAQSAAPPVITNIPLDPQITALGQSARVNWTQGLVVAEGVGVTASGFTEAQARVRARGAAIADAQRLLAAAVSGVQVDSETTVRNVELQNDTVRTRVQAFLRNVVVVAGSDRLERQSDGSFIYSISAAVPLYSDGKGGESLLGILYPELAKRQDAPPSRVQFVPVSTRPFPHVFRDGRGGVITFSTGPALLIDARGSGFKPCVAPKIVSQSGQVVFGNVKQVTPWASEHGLVGYATTEEGAAALPDRIGPDDQNMKDKSVAAEGTARCNAVVTDSAAKAILEKNQGTGFLEDFGVAIVVDPPTSK